MKTLNLLFVMAFIFVGTSIYAERRPVWHRIDDPVKITERGIDFYIFPNGDFDFNAHPYGGGDYGVRVERDRYGKIRRIGNVYLNYTRADKVSRIGHTFIRYNRRGFVKSIGRLRLHYNRGGYFVHATRPNYSYYRPAPVAYSYAPAYSYSSSYYYGNDYNTYSYNNTYDLYDNDVYENEDDYYFRQSKKGKNHTKTKKVKGRRR